MNSSWSDQRLQSASQRQFRERLIIYHTVFYLGLLFVVLTLVPSIVTHFRFWSSGRVIVLLRNTKRHTVKYLNLRFILSLLSPSTGATKDMGKMLGGEEEKDPDAQKKEEERQEALRQQEEERKAKYAKMEAERENIRQGIRDKVRKKKCGCCKFRLNKGRFLWMKEYFMTLSF